MLGRQVRKQVNWREILEVLRRRPERITMVVSGTTNLVDMFLFRAAGRVQNRNEAVLYLHGGTLNVTEKTVARLGDAKNYTYVGYDSGVPKFPDEDIPDVIQPNPVLDIVEVKDASTLIKSLTGDSVVNLVGVSRGGYLALLMMAHHPALFNRCVSMIAPIDVENKEWLATQHEWAVKYLSQTTSPMALAKQGAYVSVASRILCLGGASDPVCPPKLHVEKFSKLIGCKYKILEGSHDIHRHTEAQSLAALFLGGKL